MADKSMIIIGAGLAGLSTGCHAQMKGYRSHIFEHHTVPGGGVPPCLYSGRHVVQILCHRDGKPFSTSVP
jgi:phytoene desaturase